MQKVFEFFEIVAEELSAQYSRVLTRKDLQLNQESAPLLDELKDEMVAHVGPQPHLKPEDWSRVKPLLQAAQLHFKAHSNVSAFCDTLAGGLVCRGSVGALHRRFSLLYPRRIRGTDVGATQARSGSRLIEESQNIF